MTPWRITAVDATARDAVRLVHRGVCREPSDRRTVRFIGAAALDETTLRAHVAGKPLLALCPTCFPPAACSAFDWGDWPGIDGPVLLCGIHGHPAPCDLPATVDAYDRPDLQARPLPPTTRETRPAPAETAPVDPRPVLLAIPHELLLIAAGYEVVLVTTDGEKVLVRLFTPDELVAHSGQAAMTYARATDLCRPLPLAL